MNQFGTVTNDVELQCPHCGYNLCTYFETTGSRGTAKLWTCQQCQKTVKREFEANELWKLTHPVNCPYCNSDDCKKISGASKVASAAVFGVFSLGKVTKTWHCNSCGSNFG